MEIKETILRDLQFNITPSYRRYGISREEFLKIVNELEEEGKIFVEYVKEKLPNGNLHPHYGDVKHIILR